MVRCDYDDCENRAAGKEYAKDQMYVLKLGDKEIGVFCSRVCVANCFVPYLGWDIPLKTKAEKFDLIEKLMGDNVKHLVEAGRNMDG